MIKTNLYPTDALQQAHTDLDCWCYPIELHTDYGVEVVHRHLELLGIAEGYMTGFVPFRRTTLIAKRFK